VVTFSQTAALHLDHRSTFSCFYAVDPRKRTKVKNSKILFSWFDLAEYCYSTWYRPGKLNVGLDALTRISCANMTLSKLVEIHKLWSKT